MNSNFVEASHCPKQHNHEILGSTKIKGCCENAHNHRFATVSGDAIPCDGSHVHEVEFTTDSCDGHKHEFCGTSGPAIDVGCGRHVHLIKGCTSCNSDHKHEFVVATLIEDPICE
ncbi:YmaF family protein [Lawsonibacter sp. OA9]|uniref:YmaF family protein n=1 Tax=Oscillospiraceae TaxID=216572 RepID=UPI001F06D848|nr:MULTISPECIES: YmaF family protein [Oscillospiraceae]MCH1978191.1 YmaF family protein [Lawsonibacter sp. OA9]MCH1982443.1 YmaF family protein [Ruminococcus sp. OA3]